MPSSFSFCYQHLYIKGGFWIFQEKNIIWAWLSTEKEREGGRGGGREEGEEEEEGRGGEKKKTYFCKI